MHIYICFIINILMCVCYIYITSEIVWLSKVHGILEIPRGYYSGLTLCIFAAALYISLVANMFITVFVRKKWKRFLPFLIILGIYLYSQIGGLSLFETFVFIPTALLYILYMFISKYVIDHINSRN